MRWCYLKLCLACSSWDRILGGGWEEDGRKESIRKSRQVVGETSRCNNAVKRGPLESCGLGEGGVIFEVRWFAWRRGWRERLQGKFED